MHLWPLFVGFLAASPVIGEKCGVHFDGETPVQSSQLRLRVRAAPAPPPVDLFVHVVAGSTSRADGYLTEAEVNTQVDIIKRLYQPTGITFNHNQNMRKWYTNASWAGDSLNFSEMKETLHVGNYRTINLYLRNITTKDYGGTCTNPWKAAKDYPDFAKRLLLDGCVVNSLTIDGSKHPYMNQGKTAVHEIGHWFGLWHPFETQGVRNGVNPPDPCWEGNPDDDVADTPKMKDLGSGTCNMTQDSCPKAPGLDPVNNYMAYSSDSCMNSFTDGQVARMYAIYDEFRKNA